MAVLNWIGKEAVVNHDKEVPFKLLRKVPSASVGNESKNLIVHGDNLEALKALMPFYKEKVKCIYIDPPYNTGNEGWVYNDKVNSPKIREWLETAVETGSEDLTRHDKWLCMMHPRLKLLRELMSDDAVIMVSIDDNELNNLKLQMDEIFGEKNFIGTLVWYKKRKGSFLSKKIISLTEYILVYQKSDKRKMLFGGRPDGTGTQPLVKRTNSRKVLSFKKKTVVTRLPDGEYRAKNYGTGSSSVTLLNKVDVENGLIVNDFSLEGPFVWSQKMLDAEISKGSSVTINTLNFQPRATRIYDDAQHKGLSSFIDGRDISATNDDAYEDLKEIFAKEGVFNYSKPKNLISYLINAATHSDKSAIVLDSFAGSGTTGHAVLDLNKEDGGSRQFILVEMEDEVARKITAERIKRVIKKYEYGDGFDYCELAEPLFDAKGQINEECSYDELATYIYFTETQTILEKKTIVRPLVGVSQGVSYYLLYAGKDKNDLTRAMLTKMKLKGPAVIYADRCLVDESELEGMSVVFKQIPYEIKVY